MGDVMEEKKYRCSKCHAFEVVFVAKSANPMDTRPARFVCGKCGCEYEKDSKICLMNDNNINMFPSPKDDLEVDNPFTKDIKARFDSKRRVD